MLKTRLAMINYQTIDRIEIENYSSIFTREYDYRIIAYTKNHPLNQEQEGVTLDMFDTQEDAEKELEKIFEQYTKLHEKNKTNDSDKEQ